MKTRAGITLVTIAAAALLFWAATLFAQPSEPSTPRVAALPQSEWAAEVRGVAAEHGFARMTNLVGTYAHHPDAAEALLPHLRYVASESTLPMRHRALLALRTAWLGRSSYLWTHLAEAARREGITDAELERIARGPDADGWDAFAAALLRAADELHVDSFISDTTWETLAAHYNVNQMIDTIDTVGALTMHAGALRSLGVQLEADVDDRLPSHIPYTVAAQPTGIRLIDGEPRIPPAESGDGANLPNVFRTFTRNPPADQVRGAINSHVNFNSTLSPRQVEILLIRIGVLCHSEYEYAAHVRVGRGLGMTDEDIEHILAGPGSGADPLEDALLMATDELHRDDLVSDTTWELLAEAFDTRQLLDVLIAVGGYRSTSMLLNTAGVQLDDNLQEHRFPASMR